MTQSSFDNVRRRCSPLLRSTDGRQSQRQRDYATVEASGEIDLERPWVYTDAEIADLAARVRWAQIDLAARERWAHIENDEAFEVLKSLHDPRDGRTELRVKNLVGVLEEVPTNLFWPVFLNTWPNCGRRGRSKKTAADASTSCGPKASHQLYMHPGANEFFSLLPPMVIVFRGCAAGCSLGVSWTTTQNVAKQFALEHLAGRKLDQVLATAKINKKHIFAVCV